MSDGRSRVIVVRGGRAPGGPDAIAPLFQAPAALFQPPAVNLDSRKFRQPAGFPGFDLARRIVGQP
jgi:hypothetical protein